MAIDKMMDSLHTASWKESGMYLEDYLDGYPSESHARFVTLGDLRDINLYCPAGIGMDNLRLRGTPVDYVVKMIPRGFTALQDEGKKLIIGNGLSKLPLNAPDGILVDMIDLLALERDIHNIERSVGFDPFSKDDVESLKELTDALKKEEIREVVYRFGEGNPPQELFGAQTIVNYNGPIQDASLSEQLALLAVGGKLFTPYMEISIPEKMKPSIEVQKFPNGTRGYSETVMTKIQ